MKKRKIIFLILPNTHLLDLAGPDQVFLEAKDYGLPLDVIFCGLTEQIPTSSGLSVNKLKKFSKEKVNPGDYIIIPGADVKFLTSRSVPCENEVRQWLHDAYSSGAYICSVCTGAFFLARVGLLDGRKCTTHWKRTNELKEKFPLLKVQDNVLFTTDERILTSAGVAAGIDMALHITEQLSNENTAFKIARELVIYRRRSGEDAQHSIFMKYRNHLHTGIHTVQDYMQEHLNKKITLELLADVAFMSPRTLTRVFKKETGISVNNYITLLRKEMLSKLAADTELTRKQMAAFCGLGSERQVIRLMKTT